MNKPFIIVAIAALIGGLIGGGATLALASRGKTQESLIKEFYAVENAAIVSPHSLRRMMDKGNQSFILVDLRSEQEYIKEHIIGAVNIPAYKDPDTSAYEETDRIIGEFKKLSPDRDVIVYCYSIPCMTGRKIGKMLSANGIYVKLLGIGWNEWRHSWTMWNHEHEWKTTKPEDYIWKGREPGIVPRRDLPSPCGEGELAC